jgi:exopolysaccharide biosynthesis polyprenyl glycosylphosphotransferase
MRLERCCVDSGSAAFWGAGDDVMSSSSYSDKTSESVPKEHRSTFEGWFPAIKLHLRRRAWIALDVLLGAAAILVAYALQPEFAFGWETSNIVQPSAFQAGLIYPLFVIMSMHIMGLHDPLGDRRVWFGFLKIVIAVAVALGLYLLALYLISLQQLGRTIMIRAFFLSAGLLGVSRVIVWRLASSTPKRVGCLMRQQTRAQFTNLINSNELPVEIVFVGTEEIQGNASDIAQSFFRQRVDEVVVALAEERRDVWLECLNQGIQVTSVAVYVEREYYKVWCDDIELSWFLAIDPKSNNPFYHRFKRVFDVLAAVFGIMLSAPLLLAAGFAIFLESGRPVFYSQIRTGLRGKPYLIWKLRTMRTDAERDGAKWAVQGDMRVTQVGRILRRTRIDELPQFWNVLVGDMSMIGPRPERPEFIRQLEAEIPFYLQRHWIKPGITGWAQINYPYGASIRDAREKLSYDLYYLKNASLLLDLHIALRTIGAVMKGSR